MKMFALGVLAAASVMATTPAAAQTQAPANPGPVIPGICAYSSSILLARSTAGQSVRVRLQALEQEVQGELAPYQQQIQTEDQAISAAGAALAEPQRSQRIQALQQRAQEYQQLAQSRTADLRYTLNQQLEAIENAAGPIATAVYQERGCGVLLNADQGVNYINPAMDITATVLERLNAQLPSLTFNRLQAPVQTQQ
ncbi:MAG: OmpH family outer membrane protein [Brevundimonas sp.]|nr:MAG: OmpH family outer membrane protein [Brevundimonas sp.]